MPEYKQLSLRQAGQYDKETNAKGRLTGWGRICKDREARKVSRKQRRLQKVGILTHN
jgi:hypothetical protein